MPLDTSINIFGLFTVISGILNSPLTTLSTSGQFAALKHLAQIAVAEANPHWPKQASKPQLGTRVRGCGGTEGFLWAGLG
jgi:hypothetical protein